MQQQNLMHLPTTTSINSNHKSVLLEKSDANFNPSDIKTENKYHNISDIDLHQIETSKSLNKQKNIESTHIYTVSYKTYIEFDLHGGDYHVSGSFDWVIILKEFLGNVQNHHIEAIKFIPGQGKHTNTRKISLKEPILRPLTLVTTKMLGFDSYLDDTNIGLVVCPIEKCKTNELEKRELLFKIFADMQFFDVQNEESLSANDEKYDEKKAIIQTFHKVKEKVPNLIDECIEIISIWKKNEEEAVEFAQTFMQYFEVENLIDLKKGSQRKQLRRADKKDEFKKEEKKIYTAKLVDILEQKYGIDCEIIKRIVAEHHSEEKCERVIDMLLPYYNFITTFIDLILKTQTIPILTLFDIFKDCEFIPGAIQEKMQSESFKNLEKALDLLKIKTKINSKRDYNEFFNKFHLDMPKFLLSIEIDLKNANIEKAKQSICYVMDGLRIGKFCEMILVFRDTDENADVCKFDDILPFILEKASKDQIKLVERIKTKFRFCYLIIDN